MNALFVLLSVIEIASGQLVCQSTGSCTALCNSSLLNLANVLDYPVTAVDKAGKNNNSQENSFVFSPCEGVSCGGKERKSAVCEKSGQTHYVTGYKDTVSWYANSIEPYDYIATYAGENNRVAEIKFVENRVRKDTVFTYVGEYPHLQFNFEVEGPCVHPNLCQYKEISHHNSVTGPIGFIFISIFILGMLTYFMVGMIIMYLRGANGWELIPHIEFWRDLPSLVKDGCLWTVSPCWKRNEVYRPLT